MSARPSHGFHIHIPSTLADCLIVLAPFALLCCLAVLLSQVNAWG